MKQVFSELGWQPHRHQECAWKALERGKPIVLRAPTGSGKTEAVFLPFVALASNSLPSRLLYALPLRSLANQVAKRMEGQAEKLGKSHWRVRLQHGQAPESVLFAADVVVCTIDQLVTSYACTPLTLPLRHGNIPAGAVMSSFVVFDEVHLFDPERALQAMRLICERLNRLGLPFAVLSATLPDKVVDFWQKEFGCELIDARCEAVQRSVKIEFSENELSAEQVVETLKDEHQRILVVANTVERAINLFEQVHQQASQLGYECNLVHSRFLPDDRKAKEDWIVQRFGKDAKSGKSLLIATQVVEAGLDISADCLLTELAPIDALIQRAGRCARWGGSGLVRVFDVKSAAPYEDELVSKTREVLKRDLPSCLTWTQSKDWVNEVLNKRYEKALQGSNYEIVVANLSYASFTGDRKRAEQAVRDLDTVEVTLHEQPETLGKEVLRLPTISVHIGVVRSWLNKGVKAWRVEVDKDPIDGQLQAICEIVRNKQSIVVGDRIVFSPDKLVYDGELGLREGEGSKGFEPTLAKEKLPIEGALHKETWIEHAIKTVREIEKLLERDGKAVKGLANLHGVSEDEIKRAAKLAALLHDFGKLAIEWQRCAGVLENADAEKLLAHTAQRDYTRFPSHATISAYALWDALREVIPCQLGKAVLFAIAHHHSVRAQQVPKYRLHKSWHEAVTKAINCACLDEAFLDLYKVCEEQKSTVELRDSFPPMEYEKLYTAYVLLSKWLRLADRIATEGSEDAIFHYEDWFGRL